MNNPDCPEGVPLRIYGGYLEARAALRANAPAAANRVLEWLIGYLAEERGAKPSDPFATKLARLQNAGVVSASLPPLLDKAGGQPEKAWALLSIAENAFHKLYL